MSMRNKDKITQAEKILSVIRAEQSATADKLSRNIGKDADKIDAVISLSEFKKTNGSASFVRLLPSNAEKELRKLERLATTVNTFIADVKTGKELAPYVPKVETCGSATVRVVGSETFNVDANVFKSIRFCAGPRDSKDERIVNGSAFCALQRGMEFAGIPAGTTFVINRPELINAETGKVRKRENFTFKPMFEDGTVKAYSVTTLEFSEPENGKEYAERMKAEAEAELTRLQAEAEAEAEAEAVAMEA